MADEKDFTGNPEYEALKDMIIDPQAPEGGETPPEGGTPPAAETPPVAEVTPPEGTETRTTETPPAGGGSETPPPTPPSQGDELLKEIFGDSFTSVDEAKEANIPQVLEEVKTLRQEKADLEEQLKSKPKSDFVNDEVALFNVFVKETGINDYGVFSKLHQSDVANMDPMDALIVRHKMDNPGVSHQDGQLRKFFEKKYGYDPELEQGDEDNDYARMLIQTDAQKAKNALREVKDKLVIPEPQMEQPAAQPWSEEKKSEASQGWEDVGGKISNALAKLKVPIKNRKDALLDYEISQEEQKQITDFVKNYAVNSQMDLTQDNVKIVGAMVYNQLMVNKLPEIVHSVFEKARSLTQEEVHALYENPFPNRNQDTPPVSPESEISEEEKIQEEIFRAEMGRYDQ